MLQFLRRKKRQLGSPTSTRSEFSLGSDMSILMQEVVNTSTGDIQDQESAIPSEVAPQQTTADEQQYAQEEGQPGNVNQGEQDQDADQSGAGDPQADASKTPRARRITKSTTEDEDVKTAEQRKYESAMVKMWQRSKAPKKLAFPSKYPAYLKEPPRLAYEETSTSMRRKLFNQARIKMMQLEPPKRDEKKLTQMQPRINTAVKLRASFIRREPLVSQYFSDHYNKFRKPPFKSNGMNLRYPCYAPPISCRPSLHTSFSTTTSATTTTEPEIHDVPANEYASGEQSLEAAPEQEPEQASEQAPEEVPQEGFEQVTEQTSTTEAPKEVAA